MDSSPAQKSSDSQRDSSDKAQVVSDTASNVERTAEEIVNFDRAAGPACDVEAVAEMVPLPRSVASTSDTEPVLSGELDVGPQDISSPERVAETTPNADIAAEMARNTQPVIEKSTGNDDAGFSSGSEEAGGVSLQFDFASVARRLPTNTFVNDLVDSRQKGDLADPSLNFVPFEAIIKFPHRYAHKAIRADIYKEHFGNLTVYNQNWPIYFVWAQKELGRHPVLLTTEEAVSKYFELISKDKPYTIEFPDTSIDDGFLLIFPDHDLLRPRFLGTLNNSGDFFNLREGVPSETEVQKMTQAPAPDDQLVALFHDLMERAHHLIYFGSLDPQPRDFAGEKNKKFENRKAKQSLWQADLRRVAQVLGLRLKPIKREDLSDDAPWEVVKEHYHPELYCRPIKVDFAAPYKHPKEPVIITIDVEWYEKDATKITEIGVASFDTRDIGSMPPGRHCEHWQEHIYATHLRIKENMHLRNGEYVPDAAEEFMFGGEAGSEIVSLKDAPAALQRLFQPPFCKKARPGPNMGLLEHELQQVRLEGAPRSVLLAGHGVVGDLDKLATLGFDAAGGKEVTHIVDTSELHRALTGAWEPTALDAVLDEFEQEPWGMHNAGNDAVYTLWALLAVALQGALNHQATRV